MRWVGLLLVVGGAGCSEVDVVDGSGGASAGGGVSASVSSSGGVGASGSTSTGTGTGTTSVSTDAATTGTGGPFCGDGAIDPGEECDDGNVIDGDTCSATCVVLCEPLDPNNVHEAVSKDPVTLHCYWWNDGLIGVEPPCSGVHYYDDAQAECEAWGGDLAALSTVEEIQAVVSSGAVEGFWEVTLGGYFDESTNQWVWANGEPWTYVDATPPWAGTEPIGGTYLELYRSEPPVGYLNADIDGSSCGWLCERAPAGEAPPP